MKEFKDLEFEVHPEGLGTQAVMKFNNRYGVSVITGRMFYTNKSNPFEVAVLKDGTLTYNTHIASDVLGYQTEEDVTRIMKQVQELKDD